MKTNTVNIESGKVSYATSDSVLQTEGTQARVPVAELTNQIAAKADLVRHQKGLTDFQTFCDEMAQSGVYKWTIDLDAMSCTYYNKADQVVMAEAIPGVE